MPNEIVAHPEMPIYLFIVAVWLSTASLLTLGFVLLTKGPQLLDAAIAWCRQTFTRAGDGCVDCNRFAMTVECQTCGTVRQFAAAGVTTTRARRRTDVPSAPADVVNIAAERRRLDALAMVGPRTSGRVM